MGVADHRVRFIVWKIWYKYATKKCTNFYVDLVCMVKSAQPVGLAGAIPSRAGPGPTCARSYRSPVPQGAGSNQGQVLMGPGLDETLQ